MEFPALQVKPLEIQPNTGFVNSLLAASQIRNANTQNQLAEFGLQEKQGEKNALAEYSRLKQSGAANPENALAQFPAAQAHQIGIEGNIQKNIREKTEWALLNKGRAAASVLALPAEQQEAAFHEQLDNGLKAGWLNPLEHQAAKARPFSPQMLKQVYYNAMGVEHVITQQNRDQDRAEGKEFMGRFGRVFNGQQAGVDPPPEVVSTGGGSAVGGIPGFGAGARIVGYDPPSTAPSPTAPPTTIPPATVSPRPAATAPPATPQISPSPSLGGVNLDRMMPLLLEGAFRPGLSKEVSETSRALLLKAFDQYPQEVRQLEIFKQRPDLFELALKLKTAGATSINTAEGEEAARAKGRIAIDQAAIKDMAEKVTKSGAGIPLLQHVLEISKNTPEGYAGQLAPWAAKAASSLGIPVPDRMSNAEKFQSITRQLIPSVRDPGATSNLEQQMYQAALPNASQSHEGRTKIAEMLIRMQRREQQVVDLYRNNLGKPELSQKVEELSNKPLFTPEETQWLELQSRASDLRGKTTAPVTTKTTTGAEWYMK